MLLTAGTVMLCKPEWWPLIPVIVCVLIVIYRFGKCEVLNEKTYKYQDIHIAMTKKKHDEKGEKEEKGSEKEEKYTRDPISAIFIGVLVILLGIVFYFASNEMCGISWENVWNYILMCVGGAFLISALLHSIVPQYRRPIMGEAFIGVILVIVGIVTIYELEWWPLVLIIAGALVIIYGLGKMRRQEEA